MQLQFLIGVGPLDVGFYSKSMSMKMQRSGKRWGLGAWVLISGLMAGSAGAQDGNEPAEAPDNQNAALPATEVAPAAPAEAPADTGKVNDNPFRSIAKRNPFSLLPPPPPPPPEAPPPPPPPPPITVKLTGLTDLLGKKKAYLILTEQGPNKQPEYFSLTEGEAAHNVEVLSIDVKGKYVKINNNGQFTNMTFAKLETPAAAPGGLPGQPGMTFPGGQPRIPGVPQPNLAPPVPPAGGNAGMDANSGSVIIGGVPNADVLQRPGSRGKIFVGDGGAAAVQPSTYGNVGTMNSGAVNYGGATISSGGLPTRDPRVTPASSTPKPDRRGLTPRFTIPHIEPPPIPGRTTPTGQ